MNNHTAFVPYSYNSVRGPLASRGPLGQGLDLLLKVIGSGSCGHKLMLPQSSLVGNFFHLPALKPLPPVYRPQFPNLMNACDPLRFPRVQRVFDQSPGVLPPHGSNTKSSCQSSQKFISGEIKANAYKRRNVYKSVIRHMYSYIQKNKSKMASMLSSNGFSKKETDSAFSYISSLNVLDKQKGKAKRPQNTIKNILEEKNICVYILKETLSGMLETLNSGLTGKVMRKNTKIYKEVCQEYYNRCLQLLSHE